MAAWHIGSRCQVTYLKGFGKLTGPNSAPGRSSLCRVCFRSVPLLFSCFSEKIWVLQDGFHDSCIFNHFAKVTVKLNDGGEETITAKNIMSLGHDLGRVGSLG